MNSNENKQENEQENKQETADILIVLDESGSMSTCMTEVIQSLDKFIADQQTVSGGENALISIYKFNTRVSVPIKDVKLSEITPFANEYNESDRDETIDEYEIIPNHPNHPNPPKHPLNYIPCGMTALFDAVGVAISDKLKTDRNKNVNLMIITDGQDNSSHEHRITTIRSLIDRIRKKEPDESKTGETKQGEYNWTVFFLGKNIDAFTEGSRLSIPKQYCIRIEDNEDNDGGNHCSVKNVIRNVSACVSANRYSSYSQSSKIN